MKHHASTSFWKSYDNLPELVRRSADESFALLKDNLRHPSLHFKRVGRYRSVRVGIHWRALAVDVVDGLLWFWIGSHSDSNQLIASGKAASLFAATSSRADYVLYLQPNISLAVVEAKYNSHEVEAGMQNALSYAE